MHSEPEIILTKRYYVKVYVEGQRCRFYNGKQLGIRCNPNKSKSLEEKKRALATLQYTLKKKLESGWKPGQEPTVKQEKTPCAVECVRQVLRDIEKEQISILYRRDLQKVGNDFVNYLTDDQLADISPQQIQVGHIKAFLKRYKSSVSYYMIKRQTLGGLFYRLLDENLILQNPVYKTARMKPSPTRHRPFNKEQLKEVLDILFRRHPNLHLCALLIYGCLLRPHQEIRSLCRGDFSEDMKVISLSGEDNKSRHIRSVVVPLYVRDLLEKTGTDKLKESENIFTGNCDVYNESYFNTAWSRIKKDLVKERKITEGHTLYSFRHTAAINYYQKTKDPYKLQRLMGHGSLTTTLTYLRNLGLMTNADREEDLPDLG